MAEYTYKDIIIDPEDQRIKVGAEYYYSDFPKEVLNRANNSADSIGILERINTESPETPFVVKVRKTITPWACIIRKKEVSYAERQEKWIAANDLKEGDKVRVTRKAASHEYGWEDSWVDDMDNWIGKVFKVNFFYGQCGIKLVNDYSSRRNFPYFVLEKVKEPEKKYVPFDLSKEEDRAKIRGAWVKANKDLDKEQNVCGVCSEYVYLSCQTQGHNAEDFLKGFTFLDGTPCGKLEANQ